MITKLYIHLACHVKSKNLHKLELVTYQHKHAVFFTFLVKTETQEWGTVCIELLSIDKLEFSRLPERLQFPFVGAYKSVLPAD